MTEPARSFSCEPDPDHPGWHRWRLSDDSCYNEAVLGHMLVRAEGDDSARTRIFPQRHHANNFGGVHGGATLGFADVSLFATMYIVRGIDAGRSATVDLSAQFIGTGTTSKPLDAVVQLLRETRRLAFLRGLVVQDDAIIASFSSTVRKPSAP